MTAPDRPGDRDRQQAADDQLAAASVAGVVVDAWREHLQDPTQPATSALQLLLDLMCPAIEDALASARREGEAAARAALATMSDDTETLRRVRALLQPNGIPLHDSKTIKVGDLRAVLDAE